MWAPPHGGAAGRHSQAARSYPQESCFSCDCGVLGRSGAPCGHSQEPAGKSPFRDAPALGCRGGRPGASSGIACWGCRKRHGTSRWPLCVLSGLCCSYHVHCLVLITPRPALPGIPPPGRVSGPCFAPSRFLRSRAETQPGRLQPGGPPDVGRRVPTGHLRTDQSLKSKSTRDRLNNAESASERRCLFLLWVRVLVGTDRQWKASFEASGSVRSGTRLGGWPETVTDAVTYRAGSVFLQGSDRSSRRSMERAVEPGAGGSGLWNPSGKERRRDRPTGQNPPSTAGSGRRSLGHSPHF